MASRQQLIIERLAQLTHGFARYVAAYDELVPFNSKQLATHRETIALRSQAGSVRAAVTDLRFVTSLRRTLLAWGLGVRGSVLVPDAEFAQALTAAVPALERLEDLRIDAPDLPGDLSLDVIEMVLADEDSWDRYAAAKWLNIRRWLDANPGDELYGEMRAELTAARVRHARYQREYLGWGVFALMDR